MYLCKEINTNLLILMKMCFSGRRPISKCQKHNKLHNISKALEIEHDSVL